MHGLESYHGTWESLQLAWKVPTGGRLKRRDRKTCREAAYLNRRMHLTGYSALRPLPPAGDADRWRGRDAHKGSGREQETTQQKGRWG